MLDNAKPKNKKARNYAGLDAFYAVSCLTMPDAGSLPLNGRWWLAADVVGDAVDAAYFVDDAAGDLFQQRVGQFGPVGGHEVAGLHGTQGDDVFIGAAVAHHANALDGQEDGEGLAGEVVPGFAGGFVAEVAQFFDEDGIGFAQQVGVFFFDFAEDAHAQAGAGEGVAIDHFGRQAQGHAEFTDFVLEEFAQGFKQLEAELFGQAADVVVAFDGDGFFAFRSTGFDDIRVNGALGEEGRALVTLATGLEAGSFGLEDFDEFAANDFAFLFGVAHALKVAEELFAGIDGDDVGVELAREHVDDHFAFVLAQQAVIDEDAGELIADGAVDERGSDRGIHATREAKDDFFIADLSTDFFDGFGNVVGHDPVGGRAADVTHKALQDLVSKGGVRDFGVELHAVEATLFVGKGGNRATGGGGHALEAGWQFGDFVAVAHPDLQLAVGIAQALQQVVVAMQLDLRVAEFALLATFDFAAELLCHGLHAIADAQHGDAQIKDGFGGAVGFVGIDAGVAAGEDDAFEQAIGGEAAHPVAADVAGVDFAIDVGFAHTAGNELRDLGAEVEDEDFLVGHGRDLPGKNSGLGGGQ